MPILTLILVLALVGVLLWAVNTYIPMEPIVKKIINLVVIVAVVIWLLKVLGVWGTVSTATI